MARLKAKKFSPYVPPKTTDFRGSIDALPGSAAIDNVVSNRIRPLTIDFKLKPIKMPIDEQKYFGSEPEYQSDSIISQKDQIKAFNWYHYVAGGDAARNWTEQLVAAMPKRKHLIERYKKLPDYIIPRTVGWTSRIIMRNGHVPYSSLRYLVKTMHSVEKQYLKFIADEKNKSTVEISSKAQTETIQDRMREKFSECLGEVEGKIDEFFAAGYKGEIGSFAVFKQFNLHQNQVNEVVDWAQPKLDEFIELQELQTKKNLDDMEKQLMEGYKHVNKRQIKSAIEMWIGIIDTAKSYGTIKKAERAPRKRKPAPPEKQIKRIKFLKRDPITGIESIEPTKLVDASEVWIYNTKTRKIGVYIADEYSKALIVKGAGLLGFSEKNSRQKTLRNPAAQLKEFQALGKPAARKWLEKIKSTDIKLNGRLNEHTILLRAHK